VRCLSQLCALQAITNSIDLRRRIFYSFSALQQHGLGNVPMLLAELCLNSVRCVTASQRSRLA